MPARRTKVYPVATGPTQPVSTSPPVPENPLRIGIFIQNTGAQPGLLRFGGPTQGGGSDIAFAAGFAINWDQADTCPLESVNLSSVAATTWCVMETVKG